MADFEDADPRPTWTNLLQGQFNLRERGEPED